MYKIYPNVRKQKDVIIDGEILSVDFAKFTVYFSRKMENVLRELSGFVEIELGEEKESNVKYLENALLAEENYTLDINEEGIVINASSESGFYYATKTLKQIVKNEKFPFTLKGVHIEDWPDLKIRAYMWDISRNRVPKLETMKYVVDIMSELKMNHLELYVEGFSFEYKSFKQYLTKNAYVTLEEYLELEKYCEERYIDFVPNQNGFGHMTDWLEIDEFHNLAEQPEGFTIWDSFRPASTLDPNDPGSLELVKKMYADMLPYTKSKYFNMNFDEPHELGMGKNKELVEQSSVSDVYKSFVRKVHPIVTSYGKKALMWGDVLVRKDQPLDNLPEDIIYIDWGYDAEYHFEKHLRKLKDKNVPFMAAPGSTTWCSWLGRLYDWAENIRSAIENVDRYGGEGVILTDWGDFGHHQHLIASLAPLAYTGLLSWRNESGTLKRVRGFLNKFVFKDEQNLFADVVMDAGSYYLYEKKYRGNGTIAFATFYYVYSALQNKNPIEKYKELMEKSLFDKEHYIIINDFFKLKKKQIAMCKVDEIWKKELNHSIDFVSALSHLNFAFSNDCDKQEYYLQRAKKEMIKNQKAMKAIWMKRNKVGRLDKTLKYYDMVVEFIDLCLNGIGGTHETKDQNN